MASADRPSTTNALTVEFGRVARLTRKTLRRTQETVAVAVGVSQSAISLIERGRLPGVSLRVLGGICEVLGIGAAWQLRPPWVAGARTPDHAAPVRREGRQQDAAHARCSAYVRRRLERLGWDVAQEVETVLGRTHGWIDILAFHAATGTLLIGELKTELHDVGELQRTVAWYEREAWAVARRFGWSPRRAVTCLFILATQENDARIAGIRELFAQAFPLRSRVLGRWLEDPSGGLPRRRALVLIDPRSRKGAWVRGARVDGRRTPAPYVDYHDFMLQLPPTSP